MDVLEREYKIEEYQQNGRTYCQVFEKKKGWFGKEKWVKAYFYMYQPNKTGHFSSGISRVGMTGLSDTWHKTGIERIITLQRELDRTNPFIIDGDKFTPCIYSSTYTTKIVWINLRHTYTDRFNLTYFPYNSIEDIQREYERKKKKANNTTYI